MTIYLSGPMTGLPDLNFPAFHAEAKRLRAAGYEVFNPAEVVWPAGTTWEEYMRADIKALMDCYAIHMLPGWRKSRGAFLEWTIALGLDFPVSGAAE